MWLHAAAHAASVVGTTEFANRPTCKRTSHQLPLTQTFCVRKKRLTSTPSFSLHSIVTMKINRSYPCRSNTNQIISRRTHEEQVAAALKLKRNAHGAPYVPGKTFPVEKRQQIIDCIVRWQDDGQRSSISSLARELQVDRKYVRKNDHSVILLRFSSSLNEFIRAEPSEISLAYWMK